MKVYAMCNLKSKSRHVFLPLKLEETSKNVDDKISLFTTEIMFYLYSS